MKHPAPSYLRLYTRLDQISRIGAGGWVLDVTPQPDLDHPLEVLLSTDSYSFTYITASATVPAHLRVVCKYPPDSAEPQ